MSVLKVKDNNNNWVSIPAGGVGVPSGGSAGEMLAKSSSTDYATQWALPLSMTLLWANSNPTSNFAAQTVEFSYSGYDLLMVKSRINANGDPVATFQSATANESITSWSYLDGVTRKRVATIVSSGIQFSAAVDGSSSSTSVMVPLAIYGVKGVL